MRRKIIYLLLFFFFLPVISIPVIEMDDFILRRLKNESTFIFRPSTQSQLIKGLAPEAVITFRNNFLTATFLKEKERSIIARELFPFQEEEKKLLQEAVESVERFLGERIQSLSNSLPEQMLDLDNEIISRLNSSRWLRISSPNEPAPRARFKQRSLLFIPLTSDKLFRFFAHLLKLKGPAGPDSVIFDLEDSVPDQLKPQARELLKEHLAEFSRKLREMGKEVIVRISAVDTPFFNSDYETVKDLAPYIDTVMLSKVDNAEQIRELESKMEKDGLDFELMLLIETLEGYNNRVEIMNATKKTTALVIGAGDLSRELGVPRVPLQDMPVFAPILAELAAVAKSKGVKLIGPPFREELGSEEAPLLRGESEYLKQFGVNGKLAIYPSHLPHISQIFSLSKEEILEAMEIIARYDSSPETFAHRRGESYQGRPSYMAAKDLLRYASEHGYLAPYTFILDSEHYLVALATPSAMLVHPSFLEKLKESQTPENDLLALGLILYLAQLEERGEEAERLREIVFAQEEMKLINSLLKKITI